MGSNPWDFFGCLHPIEELPMLRKCASLVADLKECK